ncbi:uncharacterized protein N7503_010020 [Penicillium pulvis]|uniref:uncharacterized protein n=1 Tax=Penicillium pulvis TaxID=1562058 RepID=UPI0025472A6A|nr:uncharacterized protein N7503_010020 [Penicillium pulvis]KAJ5784808.1 hypothetical protein N7503_010020 [Penicillium pulvis]
MALSDVASTSNISESPDEPSWQPNMSQEAALMPDNNASINVDWRHTAAVQKLVMWPSVKLLLHPHEYDHHYLMRLERQRNTTYASDLRDIISPADSTILSLASSAHDGADGGSKSTKFHVEASITDSCAEIDQSGALRLGEKASWRYYQSYLDHMHGLHPFLGEQLDRTVEAFIKCYSPQKSTLTTEANCCHASERSPGGPLDVPSSPGHLVEVDIDNAIILLIFAVGAICENNSSTPSPVLKQRVDCSLPRLSGAVRSATLGGSTQAVNVVFTPAPLHCVHQMAAFSNKPQHTPSKPFSFLASNPNIGGIEYRGPTHTGRDECGNVVNQPVVPGLALYRFAIATIDFFGGASSIEYVHACLLAGLYAGQLADPFQSHAWISEATRACQLLVPRSPFADMKDHTEESVILAYWNCLHLESDLLAELDVPTSGMALYEHGVPSPGRIFTDAHFDLLRKTTWMAYGDSDIHLQKIRNCMHTELYKIKRGGQPSCSPSVQNAQSLNLEFWRHMLPIPLQWKDTDEPAKDINIVCMRAIYYRTKYILHLPLLYYAIHYGQPSAWDEYDAATSEGQSCRDHARLKHMLSAMVSDTSKKTSTSPQNWSPPTFDWKDLPLMMRLACRTCVECAIQGLTVYDGIEDCLVIPNIFGTAQEQFGYMLVLSATYNSSIRELVHRSTLDRLFKRTIRFLLRTENNSPTLRADIRILQEVYSKLLGYAWVSTDA